MVTRKMFIESGDSCKAVPIACLAMEIAGLTNCLVLFMLISGRQCVVIALLLCEHAIENS